MIRSFRLAVLALALLTALSFAAPARAGGWSVVVLDGGPLSEGTELTANQPLEIGFTVLQHGNKPVNGLTPQITLTPQGGGEAVTITAKAEGGSGHYVATINLPAPGVWEWQIDAFGPPASMAPISVIAPTPVPVATASPALPAPLLWVALAVATLGTLLLVVRTRRPRVA